MTWLYVAAVAGILVLAAVIGLSNMGQDGRQGGGRARPA